MLRQSAKALIVSVLVGTSTQAFQVSPTSSSACSRSALYALNRHRLFSHEVQEKSEPNSVSVGPVAALALLAATALSAAPAVAVSGGGLDYAGLDISGQDFSNGNYKGKDFTQVLAKATSFAKSNLQGCRFYKAYLVNVDFMGSDLRGASLEGTSMDGVSLKDAQLQGVYFGQSLIDVQSMENADFSDASIPTKTLPLVCDRDDVKGTNPVTGVDTRDSLMCP